MPEIDLAILKDSALARLEGLRSAQGAALLDDKPFDPNAIAAVEAELEGLAAAEAEAVRRERAAAEAEARKQHAALCKATDEDMRGAMEDIKRAQRQFRSGVAALGAAMAKYSSIRTRCKAMRLRTPASLDANAVESRLSDRVGLELMSLNRVSRASFGHLDLHRAPFQSRDDDWAEAEAAAAASDLARLKGVT